MILFSIRSLRDDFLLCFRLESNGLVARLDVGLAGFEDSTVIILNFGLH